MAATDTQTFNNFIDGESVAAAEGRTTRRASTPPTGESMAQAPDSTSEDVDRAVKAARAAFEGWSNTTPGERSLALLKLADAIEAHGDELAELEARNAGKPLQAVKDDEIPRDGRQPALLRGRRAQPGGQGRGRVPRGLHVLDAARGGRRHRPDRALELPADDGDLEDRPGARDRQHDRPQARAHARR